MPFDLREFRSEMILTSRTLKYKCFIYFREIENSFVFNYLHLCKTLLPLLTLHLSSHSCPPSTSQFLPSSSPPPSPPASQFLPYPPALPLPLLLSLKIDCRDTCPTLEKNSSRSLGLIFLASCIQNTVLRSLSSAEIVSSRGRTCQ